MEDHKALSEVFGHVEKVMAIRKTASGNGRGGKVMRTGKSFRPPPPDPGHDGLSTVMLEIRGARVDPDKVMKALEANQRARHKDLMARSNEFQEELGDFVTTKRLKKTGGIQEAERLRQARNDYALKNMFTPATGGVSGGGMMGSSSGASIDSGGGLGMAGFSFAKAPAGDYDDGGGSMFSAGSGGGGLGGFSFAKAPSTPDSP